MIMTVRDRIKYAAQSGVPVLIHGEPGVGKSFLALEIAKEIANERGVGDPIAIIVPEDAAAAELRGHYIPTGENWTWLDGPVVASLRSGRPLIMDELSHASPEAHTWLHQALDDTPYLTLPNGDTVNKILGTPIIATQNQTPDKLRAAMRDRFTVQIHMTTPEQSAYDALAYGAHARNDTDSNSLRRWVALERITANGLDLEVACELLWPGRGDQAVTAIKLGTKG